MTALLTSFVKKPPAPAVERNYISFSAISTYQQCPLRYYFRYLEQLPEDLVSANLVLGGTIHSAAEFHFNELMTGNPPPNQHTLLAVFWDAWRDRGEEAEIQFGKGEDVTTLTKLADRILNEFRQSDLAQPQGWILGVEEQLRGELIPGVPELLARIDLIVETADAVTIGGRFTTFAKAPPHNHSAPTVLSIRFGSRTGSIFRASARATGGLLT